MSPTCWNTRNHGELTEHSVEEEEKTLVVQSLRGDRQAKRQWFVIKKCRPAWIPCFAELMKLRNSCGSIHLNNRYGAPPEIVKALDKSKRALERIPSTPRYMAFAIHFEDVIGKGIVTDYAALARLGHVTIAPRTQIVNLRLLAPDIQIEILNQATELMDQVGLKMIEVLAKKSDWNQQRKPWHKAKTVGYKTFLRIVFVAFVPRIIIK